MSDNIPFEIQAQIIERIFAVKSLIRFRSVSKQWKSLIDSSEFITHHHSLLLNQPHHLLISYKEGSDYKYVSIVDDDCFPHHKFCPTVKLLRPGSMLDSPHGLVCFYLSNRDLPSENNLIVLWNPSIQKSVEIVLPNRLQVEVVGFGVCRKTSDPKIVIIDPDRKVEVFTLSSRAWRSLSMNLCEPLNSFRFESNHVVTDGIIYWVAYSSGRHCNVIISFDLTSEEFGETELPDSLACFSNLSISKLNDSLVVLNYYDDARRCDVWMMSKNGDPKSVLTKLFTVSFKGLDDSVFHKIVGFRKNGQAIIEHLRKRDGNLLVTLEVYEPFGEGSNDLGADTRFTMTSYDSLFMTTSYTESLLLLNHSGSIIEG